MTAHADLVKRLRGVAVSLSETEMFRVLTPVALEAADALASAPSREDVLAKLKRLSGAWRATANVLSSAEGDEGSKVSLRDCARMLDDELAALFPPSAAPPCKTCGRTGVVELPDPASGKTTGEWTGACPDCRSPAAPPAGDGDDEKLLESIFGDQDEIGGITVQGLIDELSKVKDKEKSVLINRMDRVAETHEAWTVRCVIDRTGYFDLGLGSPTDNFDTSPMHREEKRQRALAKEATQFPPVSQPPDETVQWPTERGWWLAEDIGDPFKATDRTGVSGHLILLDFDRNSVAYDSATMMSSNCSQWSSCRKWRRLSSAPVDEVVRLKDRANDLASSIAMAADHMNIWAREWRVEEAGAPFDGDNLRSLAERLWLKAMERAEKVHEQIAALTAELAEAKERVKELEVNLSQSMSLADQLGSQSDKRLTYIEDMKAQLTAAQAESVSRVTGRMRFLIDELRAKGTHTKAYEIGYGDAREDARALLEKVESEQRSTAPAQRDEQGERPEAGS